MEGPEQFKRLWITMYNYFVNDRGLNNLIWVLCYTGDPDGNWFPGNEYVDIAGADTYGSGNGSHRTMYDDVVNNIGGNEMPIAYHECGVPPDPEQCFAEGAMWSWWMEWHTTWLTDVDAEYLSYVFNHELVLTLDELPDIMTACGDLPCNASEIISYVQINNNEWYATDSVLLNINDTLSLGPHPYLEEGIWEWNGSAINGEGREQTFIATNSGSYNTTVIFTNSCGTQSSIAIHIEVETNPIVSQTIQLQTGWNLISINVVPDNLEIMQLFAGLPVSSVKTMSDFWLINIPQYLNSLQELSPGIGFLVKADSNTTLEISGEIFNINNFVFPNSTTWEMIGCPFQEEVQFSEIYNNNNCNVIKNLDGFWMPDGTQNSLLNFVPGEGYFLK